ncbi:hypothetical protein GCM10023201_03690 [Actinomycetospora corticicola]|uniref:AraC-like DNA-binding protein n=1 Tax=Actinomycetospora corticicola TaxID=663602 RepID=A0A7Y9E2M5_9PSEU|nr:helix-turn-helix transcriptional regulator [Actinomycetospora corticicola]NYD39800.1 AraC-like DNA-binding protein [Actinomycetospora corticicola]
MTERAAALIQHDHFASGDPDEAFEWMRTAYTEHTPELHGDRASFAFDVSSTSTIDLDITTMAHSMGFLGPSEPADGKLITMAPRAGSTLRLRLGEERYATDLMLAPTWTSYVGQWEHVVMQTVTLDERRVAVIAAELTGALPSTVRFEGVTAISKPLERHWRALTEHVRADLLSLNSPPPLLLAGAFRQLATAMLTTFPNTALHAANRYSVESMSPRALRRALDYIEEHAHEDIGITEIAAAARIGVRALQLAFRRHLDRTPIEHLRETRMGRAHVDLLNAGPSRGDTVAAIAMRWGFSNPGRFSDDYRNRYDRYPRDVLKS